MVRHARTEIRGRAAKSRQIDSPTGSSSMRLSSGSGTASVMEFAVALDPTVLKTLSVRQSTVRSLMDRFAKSIARTEKSGQATGFTVTIDANGNPKFAALPDQRPPAQAKREDDRLENALEAARERGRLRSAEILDQRDMLTAEEFAARLGVSRMTVNARRQKHELLGLGGAKRGFRFPAWQVDDDGRAFDVLPKLFDMLGENPWTVYRFLTQRHSALEGVSAKDALHRGRVTQVLQAAESLSQGDFA
jgi:hypothetical protein